MKNFMVFWVMLVGMYVGFSQNYYMTAPEGFGAATTGGGNTTPITVTTLTELRNALKATPQQVILVSGTINIPAGQYITELVKDKSLIGLPGARLVNLDQTAAGAGILNLKPGSTNVIIRNLIFEGPGAYDVNGRDNLTADGCTNLWVDHCEFQDAIDGNFDIKGLSDNITVSWCKFTYLKPAKAGGSGGSDDHRFSNLIGSSSTDAPTDTRFSVTFLNNYWADGVKARMPRARNAELHLVNCYYYTNVTGSVALGLGGGSKGLTCYVENTHFGKVTTVYQNYNSTDGGTVALNFDNCIGGVANVGTVTKPTYSYTTIPVADVASVVTNESCGAGATLQVTAAGVISSSCGSLGIKEELLKLGVTAYPSVVDTVWNLNFSETPTGVAHIVIYNSRGQQVYAVTKNGAEEKLLSLNLETFAKGFYVARLRVNQQLGVVKFIKK